MITVRLPDELRDRIDAVRGDVPRERWVRRALEAALGEPSGGQRSEAGSSAGDRRPPAPSSPRAPEVPYELPKIAKRKW